MLTIREVIKTFYNALLQRLKKHRGNWEQNDPTADDYIKNRPFYTDENDKEIVVKKTTFTTTGSNELCRPFFFEPVVGSMYDVIWDGKLYECVAYEFNGTFYIGNLDIAGEGKNIGEPFLYCYYNDVYYGLYVRSPGTYTVEISCAKVVKLDKKYIPDLGLAPVAKSGSYDDLFNRPIVYSDVVRYTTSQSLSTSQKNVARTNIGAGTSNFSGRYNDLSNKPTIYTDVVRYGTSQSLTTSQKNVARNNIGAGTSSFSGSYNDLTNKPNVVQYSTQTLTDSQKQQARENIGAGTSSFSGSYIDLTDKPFPNCTTDNNGQFLRVVNGVATWSTIPNAEGVSF